MKEMPDAQSHEYLQLLRRESGLTQAELAFLLGLKSGSKISRYERSRRRPGFRTLLGLEIALRASLEMLFAKEGNRARRQLRKRAAVLLKRGTPPRRRYSARRRFDFLMSIVHLFP